MKFGPLTPEQRVNDPFPKLSAIRVFRDDAGGWVVSRVRTDGSLDRLPKKRGTREEAEVIGREMATVLRLPLEEVN